MKFLDSIKARFEAIRQKIAENKENDPPLKQNPDGKQNTFDYICRWVYKLRSVFMAIPVLTAAVILAIRNSRNLPEKIAVYFPSFSADKVIIKLTELERGSAVMIPLLLTIASLALMFCSRRTVYPWIISIFTLILPLFFLFVGMYPV